MSNGKLHTSPPEMRPISLAEYRANQEAVSGKLDSVITIIQTLKFSSYQSKA